MTGSITDVPGIRVGHAEVPGGGSGCTVILGPFRARMDVPGMATGSRELDVLRGEHVVDQADALLLTGGSAFGLAAADGVMAWLEERGIGHVTRLGPVPIVPAAVLFDLAPGRARPGPEDGRRACDAASDGPVREGRVGAGAGATVDKLRGIDRASPGGVGSASRPRGRWTVGAFVVVNAVGRVTSREEAPGAFPPSGPPATSDPSESPERRPEDPLHPGEHTTLAVVATDAPLGGADLTRVARLAATALARRITPVHTPFDGDLTFALSTAGDAEAFSLEEVTGIGLAAREALEDAIVRGVSPEVDEE